MCAKGSGLWAEVKINGVRWSEIQKRARQSFPVMGFGLCLREQRGSSHVSCAEGRASRAVNVAEVEGSVIPWLLAILTDFSLSLPFSLLSLAESRKSLQKSLWILHPTAGMWFKHACRHILFLYGLLWDRVAGWKIWLLAPTGVFRLVLNWWTCAGWMWHFAPWLQRVRKDSVFSPLSREHYCCWCSCGLAAVVF